ncbi:hypothetical protein I79_009110 [Cricetulus griseus]|uniref:Uncharacterized protein n=1 Tax=Cricetulus griseus TaxID=10029 RepID=G3HEW3_CRIGR|nr:hypothetical protein I79_009110 [Cricetulus griseus]
MAYTGMMDQGLFCQERVKSGVLIKSMKFNCIPEFFSLLYFKERKGRNRNRSEKERGKEEVFIWVEQEAQSILDLYYRGECTTNSHTHRKAMYDILIYCAHSSKSIRADTKQ